MVKRHFLNKIILFFVGCMIVGSGMGYAKKELKRKPTAIKPVETGPQNKHMREVFHMLDASSIGDNTHMFLKPKQLSKLNDFGDLIVSRMAFRETKNPLYVDNPDLHRLLCFFINSYVYASEFQKIPPENQIYVVALEDVQRDAQLTIEIQNVQHIFNQCQKLEVKLTPVGAVYFSWDNGNVLNAISDEPPPQTQEIKIPKAFKDDPLLAKLFQTEASIYSKKSKEDSLGSELLSIILEGLRNQMASGKPNLAKLGKRIQGPAGAKIAEKIWKERETLIASLSRDDANLFSISQNQKEIARSLTHLVAFPGQAMVSDSSFVEDIKNIMSGDLTVNIKAGKEMIYVGFKLKLY